MWLARERGDYAWLVVSVAACFYWVRVAWDHHPYKVGKVANFQLSCDKERMSWGKKDNS